MSFREKVMDAQRGEHRYAVDYPEATSSSSGDSAPNSASSEPSNYAFDVGQFNYDTADMLKPGLKNQVRMVAQARRKMLAERDSVWANDKAWGWTVDEDFDGTPYLKPAKEDEVPEGQGWWHSLNEYLNSVASWANPGAINQSLVDDAVYKMATTALERNLQNIDENYGYTGDLADSESLAKHRAAMAKQIAQLDPAQLERENALRQQARNAYDTDKDLFKFEQPNQIAAMAKNMVIPGLNAVMEDPELWKKTSALEKVWRGGTDAALFATSVAAPEMFARNFGARSAFLGSRPVLNYGLAGAASPVAMEGLERARDATARFFTDYGTMQRPFDPADLGVNMFLGGVTGGIAGKVAPSPKADYRFVQKGKNLENEIAAANKTGNPKATLQDMIAEQGQRAEVTAQQQADRIAQLEKEIADLKAKDAAQVQPDINAELKRQMWERGNRGRLEDEAIKAGKQPTAKDFITDKDLGDISMSQDDFVRTPFKEYDAKYPNSAYEVQMFPEPHATSPDLGVDMPLITTEGIPNQTVKGATVSDLRRGKFGSLLGKEFDDPDLAPFATSDPRKNLVGFKFDDKEIGQINGKPVMGPTFKNGQNYVYLGWDKPSPDFIQRFAKELGVDLTQYPKEFVDKELPVLVQKYLAGDPATRRWVGNGMKLMTEAERRGELQALKGKQMQSGVPGMATDASDKNMGLVNWIEHEGKLGTIDPSGVFVPATPEQIAARNEAMRGYSARKAMYKPDQQKVDEVTASVQKKHDDAMAQMEKTKRSEVEKQNKAEDIALSQEKKKLNNLELRQNQLMDEAKGKGAIRTAAKNLGYFANAVGQSAPLSQLPPFDWFIDFIPNKTMKPNPDNASENRQRAWDLGLEQPEEGDEYYKAYLRWKRRQEQKNK